MQEFLLPAARANNRTAGIAHPGGDEVRVRGRQVAHDEEGAQAALARHPVQPQQPGDARGRPFALPDASLRSRKFVRQQCAGRLFGQAHLRRSSFAPVV